MRVDELVRFGVPQILIERWRARQGETLLPLQSACARGGLCDPSGGPRAALVAGPTSAGKSFCGELALAGALSARGKGVLLVPLKSVAEEKFAALEPVYRELGLRAVIATADHPESDRALQQGTYDIAICVYEKFNRLLVADIDSLAQISALVIDELQLLHDAERGPLLERILIKLRGYPKPPRLVGLLCSGSGESELAEWLGAELIRERSRPVELRRGVAVANSAGGAGAGRFDYREFNSGAEASEEFALGKPAEEHDHERDTLDEVIERVVGDAGQSLIFVASRNRARAGALRLASASHWPRAQATLDELAGEEVSGVSRSLAQALTRGVAFHTGDLNANQRAAVEAGFRSGEIRALLCTATLALGVNLPADTVYIEPFKYQFGAVNGPLGGAKRGGYCATPLTQAEFDGAAGRAGRYRPGRPKQTNKMNTPIARAVMIARSEFEREALWRAYIEPQNKTPHTAPRSADSSALLALELILCGLGSSVDDLEHYFALGYWPRVSGNPRDSERIARCVESALAFLREREILSLSPGGELRVERAVRAGVLAGLSPSAVSRFVRLIERERPATDREWLAAALSAPDVETMGVLPQGRSDAMAERALYAELPDEAERLLRFLQAEPETLDRRLARRISALSALELWRSGAPVAVIERRCGLPSARIERLAECVGWALNALAEMCAVADRGFAERERLRRLGVSLAAGLPPELRELRRAFGGLPNRAQAVALYELGARTPDQLAALPKSKVTAALSAASVGGPQKLLADIKHLQSYPTERSQADARDCSEKESVIMSHTAPTTQQGAQNSLPTFAVAPSATPRRPAGKTKEPERITAVGASPSRLEIDGSPEGERFLIRVDGTPVALTGKSFKYLARLAAGMLLNEEGWTYKDDIEQGFNQARYLYRMRHEVEAGLPGYRWAVYENNRLGYYRLRLDPAGLEINVERLLASDDYEVAEIARALAARSSGVEARRSA